MFWHEVVYLELLYCATNFELVWILSLSILSLSVVSFALAVVFIINP